MANTSKTGEGATGETTTGGRETSINPPARTLEIERFTPKTQIDEWVIDGGIPGAETQEVATHAELSLTFRVETQELTDVLRPLKTDEGKVDRVTVDDGGYTAIDRAGGSNSYNVIPPSDRRPLRQSGTYHVGRYEEQLISQTVDEWDVELELIPDENRTDTEQLNEGINGAAFDWTFPQTFGRGEWGFTTRYGSISTERVDAEFAGTGANGVERYEITARLTFTQAHSFESALARQDGTRIKEIPDEPNTARDETSGANTITIDSPDNDTITDGDYILIEPFESERLNDAYQQVSFVVAPV